MGDALHKALMSDQQSVPGEAELDVHLRALAHPHRRTLISILSDHNGSLTMADLAKLIVSNEQELDPEDAEKVLHELYHRHVPMLADCGLVTYEEKRRVVDITEDATHWISIINSVEKESSKENSKQSCC